MLLWKVQHFPPVKTVWQSHTIIEQPIQLLSCLMTIFKLSVNGENIGTQSPSVFSSHLCCIWMHCLLSVYFPGNRGEYAVLTVHLFVTFHSGEGCVIETVHIFMCLFIFACTVTRLWTNLDENFMALRDGGQLRNWLILGIPGQNGPGMDIFLNLYQHSYRLTQATKFVTKTHPQ